MRAAEGPSATLSAAAAAWLAWVSVWVLTCVKAARCLPGQRRGSVSHLTVPESWAAGLRTANDGTETFVVVAPAELAATSVAAYLDFVEREAGSWPRLKIARGVCPVIDVVGSEARRRGYQIEWVRDRFERSGWLLTRPN